MADYETYFYIYTSCLQLGLCFKVMCHIEHALLICLEDRKVIICSCSAELKKEISNGL